nr:WAS/WASL-interacting protein family member 3-like [Vicugna pacos]
MLLSRQAYAPVLRRGPVTSPKPWVPPDCPPVLGDLGRSLPLLDPRLYDQRPFSPSSWVVGPQQGHRSRTPRPLGGCGMSSGSRGNSFLGGAMAHVRSPLFMGSHPAISVWNGTYLPWSLKLGFPHFSKLALVQKSDSPGWGDKLSPGEEALPTPLTSLLLVTPKLQSRAHLLGFPASPSPCQAQPPPPAPETPPERSCGALRVRTPSPVSRQRTPQLIGDRPGSKGGALSPKTGCVALVRSQPCSPASRPLTPLQAHVPEMSLSHTHRLQPHSPPPCRHMEGTHAHTGTCTHIQEHTHMHGDTHTGTSPSRQDATFSLSYMLLLQ